MCTDNYIIYVSIIVINIYSSLEVAFHVAQNLISMQ